MIDEQNALDEACEMFATAWSLSDWTPNEAGGPPAILWEGRPSQPPSTDIPYVRFTMTPTIANQSSFTPGEEKVWLNQGIISVQSFAPIEWADAYEFSNYMGIMAKRVYQGKSSPNGMWFRNCRTNRIGPSGGWYQFNTIIEYQFNEQR